MAISRAKEDLGQLSLDEEFFRERYGLNAGESFSRAFLKVLLAKLATFSLQHAAG